ncbi:uncharacterized protein LOC110108155, partial [Dendrobium catenatum]|uniref:uncharacterized protein LOC110108155 n=1 Tax=Dendrobium catenatum TaxID=906689 RepID=UPI00109FB370
MRPFGRPVARQPARAPARPVVARPVLVHAQPPARPAVRRPAPAAPVVRVAPAPQRRQPVVPLPAAPVEAPRARVSPPPSSSRKRVAHAELPPPTHRVSVFTRLSHPEIAEETPTPPQSVVPVPPVPSVGTDVASSSTSDLGRRAMRNRNRRLRLAASDAAVQRMADSLAQQEPIQQRMVPLQREPHRRTDTPVTDVVLAPEIDVVQGGCFSPQVHSGDEEDAAHITAAPPVPTTLPRARVPRDTVTRTLTQRIRSIIRSARGRGRVSEERLLHQISQVHSQLQRQLVRQSYRWQRRQPPRQQTIVFPTGRPQADVPTVGRRPRRHGRRPQLAPARPQLGSVVVSPSTQSDVPSGSRRSRWVWRRRQVEQPIETEQTVGTIRRVDTVPLVSAPVQMSRDTVDVEGSTPARVRPVVVPSPLRISSSLGPYIDALHQTSDDDLLEGESDEDIPVHRVCVVMKRGTSDEQHD